jgi:hypothetical protein
MMIIKTTSDFLTLQRYSRNKYPKPLSAQQMQITLFKRLVAKQEKSRPTDASASLTLRMSAIQYKSQQLDDFYASTRLLAMLMNQRRPTIHLIRKRRRNDVKVHAEFEKVLESIVIGAPDVKRLRLTEKKLYDVSPRPVAQEGFLMQLVRLRNLQYLEALANSTFSSYHLQLIAYTLRNLRFFTLLLN